MIDLLIRGGIIVDGTGSPPVAGDVGTRDDVIVAVTADLASAQPDQAAHIERTERDSGTDSCGARHP